MYEYFLKNYLHYLIENTAHYLIYLIPGEDLSLNFKWYGEERAKAFKRLYSNSLTNDIEERDFYYTHMVIWDKKCKELAAGQRFLFNKKGEMKNKLHSYLEYYHPKTYEILINISFCEIGRTFIMPNFQKSIYLMELIRGFVRIPESKNISLGLGLISFDQNHLKKDCVNYFLEILDFSKTKTLDIPDGKYSYEQFNRNKKFDEKFILKYENLRHIEKKLKNIDSNFKMPDVLKPYLRYCGISYETYSIAKDYNGKIQLLFSGKSENISLKQRQLLKKYNYNF